jgi:hypothetical protein
MFPYVEATQRYFTRFEKQLGSAWYMLHAGFLLGVFFYPEDVGNIFLRNTV